MLERLLEQRRAVTTTLPETNCSVELTMHQWTLLGHLVALLRPFEEFSREFERQDACLSLVIPAVRLLQQHVSKPLADGESQVSRKVRKQLDDSLQQRFLGVAQNLLSKILAMLEAWEINQKRVTCFVRDNAANITAATREGGFCHIGCVDHTLQLVITDGLKDDTVSALLKSAKAIVGHFNRSTVAQHLLSGVQTQLQLPQHQLMKECTTRWNGRMRT